MVRTKAISPVVISSTEAQTHFGEIIRRVYRNGDHIIVERSGFPVVVIIPLSDYDLRPSTSHKDDPTDDVGAERK